MYFIFLALVAMAPWPAGALRAQADSRLPPAFSCEPELARMFAPSRPQLGRYEICATDRPIEAVAEPAWTLEALAPLDAFGRAGSYDPHVLSRLYGGRRAIVARGWTTARGQFEAVTLISPHPDAALTRLLPGTLRIRLIICCQ